MRKTTRLIYSLVAAGALLPAVASAAPTPAELRAKAQADAQRMSSEGVRPVEVAENVRGEQAEYEFVGRFHPLVDTGPPGHAPIVGKYLRLTYGPGGMGITIIGESFGPPAWTLPVPSFRGKTRIGAGAVGAVKLGDSERQVILAWGSSCAVGEGQGSCLYDRAVTEEGIPTEGSVIVEFRKFKVHDIRIEGVFPAGQISFAPAFAKLKTAKHIGLGSTEAQLLHAYHHMHHAGSVWEHPEPARHELVFEIIDNVVGRIDVRQA